MQHTNVSRLPNKPGESVSKSQTHDSSIEESTGGENNIASLLPGKISAGLPGAPNEPRKVSDPMARQKSVLAMQRTFGNRYTQRKLAQHAGVVQRIPTPATATSFPLGSQSYTIQSEVDLGPARLVSITFTGTGSVNLVQPQAGAPVQQPGFSTGMPGFEQNAQQVAGNTPNDTLTTIEPTGAPMRSATNANAPATPNAPAARQTSTSQAQNLGGVQAQHEFQDSFWGQWYRGFGQVQQTGAAGINLARDGQGQVTAQIGYQHTFSASNVGSLSFGISWPPPAGQGVSRLNPTLSATAQFAPLNFRYTAPDGQYGEVALTVSATAAIVPNWTYIGEYVAERGTMAAAEAAFTIVAPFAVAAALGYMVLESWNTGDDISHYGQITQANIFNFCQSYAEQMQGVQRNRPGPFAQRGRTAADQEITRLRGQGHSVEQIRQQAGQQNLYQASFQIVEPIVRRQMQEHLNQHYPNNGWRGVIGVNDHDRELFTRTINAAIDDVREGEPIVYASDTREQRRWHQETFGAPAHP